MYLLLWTYYTIPKRAFKIQRKEIILCLCVFFCVAVLKSSCLQPLIHTTISSCLIALVWLKKDEKTPDLAGHLCSSGPDLFPVLLHLTQDVVEHVQRGRCSKWATEKNNNKKTLTSGSVFCREEFQIGCKRMPKQHVGTNDCGTNCS